VIPTGSVETDFESEFVSAESIRQDTEYTSR